MFYDRARCKLRGPRWLPAWADILPCHYGGGMLTEPTPVLCACGKPGREAELCGSWANIGLREADPSMAEFRV